MSMNRIICRNCCTVLGNPAKAAGSGMRKHPVLTALVVAILAAGIATGVMFKVNPGMAKHFFTKMLPDALKSKWGIVGMSVAGGLIVAGLVAYNRKAIGEKLSKGKPASIVILGVPTPVDSLPRTQPPVDSLPRTQPPVAYPIKMAEDIRWNSLDGHKDGASDVTSIATTPPSDPSV